MQYQARFLYVEALCKISKWNTKAFGLYRDYEIFLMSPFFSKSNFWKTVIILSIFNQIGPNAIPCKTFVYRRCVCNIKMKYQSVQTLSRLRDLSWPPPPVSKSNFRKMAITFANFYPNVTILNSDRENINIKLFLKFHHDIQRRSIFRAITGSKIFQVQNGHNLANFQPNWPKCNTKQGFCI